MTRFAQTERAALCDTAARVGATAPTLDEGWTVRDLLVHLLVREGSLASVGIAVAPLKRFADRAYAKTGRQPFTTLVERVRTGPPRLSPFAIPKLDELGNTMEFFVHHEDIRRAQPSWEPRVLGDEVEATLWGGLGKMLARKAPDGLVVEHSGTGASKTLKEGTPSVTVRGLPSEVTLFMTGRSEQARVDLLGDAAVIARLRDTSLGM